ncbi:MAG: polyribonucleotide nucleotidyltransferase [Acidobacteriota bacterium]|nr:polyribonucleotide nucleotidyltransferase [Acidobacteriota bacterium]
MKHVDEARVGETTLSIETGRIAKQADGSCIIRCGDTMVLSTACRAPEATPRGFLPLTVDYREGTAAAGRIPGGFFKREGRPTEKEILTCRMTDRPLRPLFPKGYFHETQLISFVLSADGENDPDVLAINGAATALALSGIPFYERLGAVRVGRVEGQLVFNPTNSYREVSDLDLIVVATEKAVVMVEAAANQLPEQVILDAIFAAHAEIQNVVEAQKRMQAALGVVKPEWVAPADYSGEVIDRVRSELGAGLREASATRGKLAQKTAIKDVVTEFLATVPEDEAVQAEYKKAIQDVREEILRETVLGRRVRLDGRALDEIRELSMEAGLLPRTHGSALFTRGETQALVTTTLGTGRDAQIIEEYEGESRQRFLLHYGFPPFSVGEVKFLRGPGRREIGHGVLARRALTPVLPSTEDFPYTIRVVSEIMESNGSSSMATVCGGSLALFDAGVPMLAPVAGVAMGLIKGEHDFAVLSDIAGQEDHSGDMDFKVAGSRDGITALQMDIKIAGVTREIMQTALEQARAGRIHILDAMARELGEPRGDLSQFAPRLHTIYINKEKIRDIIGPGGKTIRSITEETGCEIEIGDDGKIVIGSPDGLAAQRAIEIIERLTETPEVGKNYTGIVRRIEDYGAFLEILPGTDGLLHISELAPYRVKSVTDILKDGDEAEVKVISIEDNRVRLSRKAVIMEAPGYDPKEYEGMGYDGPPVAAKAGDRDSRGRRPQRGGRRPPRR